MFQHDSAGLLKYSHIIYGAKSQIHKLYYIGLEEDQLNIRTKDKYLYLGMDTLNFGILTPYWHVTSLLSFNYYFHFRRPSRTSTASKMEVCDIVTTFKLV